ncbi:MAG: ABC-ATPase domain-containing protein [Myxococcota bacterium]|nr:ABC-ATPase domain-containing protein [Myxococcota bacterium]
MARDDDEEGLRRLLRRIDGRGYKAYRDLRGRWRLGPVELHVDHVQGDPFAAPSRVRARLSLETAKLPEELFATRTRRIALEDHLARGVRGAARRAEARRGSGKSGLVAIDAGGQTVLERTAVRIGGTDAGPGFVEARLEVGLPAAGRRVLGREAEALLTEDVPRLALRGLCADPADAEAMRGFVACVENHEHLVAQLPERGLVAFVADGSVLPRESGASDRPLASGAIPFEAPETLAVELEVPHPVPAPGGGESRRVRGLGVPRGVTLIVGGGYHGKSTLLRALERGVHPHVPGDGRERVATVPDAVKVRAEDGRRVAGCDIHAFIGDLPQGRSTRSFGSEDASGSTSQAANIVEAVEAGARTLLLDEDTSATNFMVRDARMQALVHRDHEPITPFVDRVRELFEKLGVSTVLVMGGCGDYFDVADTVIEMHDYRPGDVTDRARRIAAESPGARRREAREPLAAAAPRCPVPASLDPSRGRRDVKIEARSTDQLGFGTERVELRGLEQLVDPSQTRAIGHLLVAAKERFMGPGVSLPEVLDRLEAFLDEGGLDRLVPRGANLARPRRFEIAGALNRLRSLQVEAGRG